jgi:hypothetical protein
MNNTLDKQYTDLITLSKSDVMYLIACAMGYGWNASGGYRDGDFEKIQKRKELEKENLLKWATTISQNKNEQTR